MKLHFPNCLSATLLVAALLTCCGYPNPTAEPVTVRLGRNEIAAAPNPAQPGVNVPAIKVNTVGYAKDWKKMVVFNVDPTGAVVINAHGETVLEITADAAIEFGIDQSSKDPVWQVDISDITQTGTYVVEAAEKKNKWFQSSPFVVDDYWAVQAHAIRTLIKSFYFQRTRTSLTEPYARWNGFSYIRRGVSHTHDDVGWDWQYYPQKREKWQNSADKQWWPGEPIRKGWFDAGNFDMYVPSTAVAAQVLLISYMSAPELFSDGDQNIPESANDVPDILDEITWGLDWILSMQQKDGGFRHSEAVKEWAPPMPADEDKTVRWIRPESSASTAKAVAVLAMAASVYRDFPQYESAAAQYEAAARLGWSWLLAHPAQLRWDSLGSPQPMWDDDNKTKDETGDLKYNDIGARWAAAVEMWVRFRDKSALATVYGMYQAEQFPEILNIKEIVIGSWTNISRFGLIEMAFDEDTPKEIRQFATTQIVRSADEYLLPRWERDGYRVMADSDEYYWGFNANTAEKVYLMAMAAKLTQNSTYMEAARDGWHWLMGRNPNGYSMATGIGSMAPTQLYHMEWGDYPSRATSSASNLHQPVPAIPGYAVGGPNYADMRSLAPNAPAKALLWDNPDWTRTGSPPHQMWHWRQEALWDGKFLADGSWNTGWWCVTGNDIQYSADFVLAGISIRNFQQPDNHWRMPLSAGEQATLLDTLPPYTRRSTKVMRSKNSPHSKYR